MAGAAMTVEEYLLERFDRIGRQMAFKAQDLDELGEWQTALRARLRQITGIDTMQSCPLDPQAGPIEKLDGYTRQRIVITTEPGVAMPFYVLVPDDLQAGERRPMVLAPHGHGGGGKDSVAGRYDIPEIAAAITQYNYDYGVQIVRRGMIALCPDARGFGERRERTMDDGDLLGGSCRVINNMAIPLGQTLTGMWVWDLMRLIDYAATRPDCDIGRLGCAGLSGGGHQAIWLAALDDRVTCVVVSGYFYGYKDALLRLNQNCSCNYVPGLWQTADMGDLGAMIAPRPLLIESGSLDDLNGPSGIPNVVSQLKIARQAYRLFGVEERLTHSVFEGGHRWDGTDGLPWLSRWLG